MKGKWIKPAIIIGIIMFGLMFIYGGTWAGLKSDVSGWLTTPTTTDTPAE